MTLVWAVVPAILVLGATAIAVLVRRLDDTVHALQGHHDALQRARLATVVVEDDLEALRAVLAQMPRR